MINWKTKDTLDCYLLGFFLYRINSPANKAERTSQKTFLYLHAYFRMRRESENMAGKNAQMRRVWNASRVIILL